MKLEVRGSMIQNGFILKWESTSAIPPAPAESKTESTLASITPFNFELFAFPVISLTVARGRPGADGPMTTSSGSTASSRFLRLSDS